MPNRALRGIMGTRILPSIVVLAMLTSCEYAEIAVEENIPSAQGIDSCEELTVFDIKSSGHDGNVPENTQDNLLDTRWSDDGIGSWIQVDLGGTYHLCGIDIAWYRGEHRQNTFVLSTSIDGTHYEEIYRGTSSGSSHHPEYIDTSTISSRYLRITVLGNTENVWASITEIDVHGSRQDADIRPYVRITHPSSDAVNISQLSFPVRGISSDGGNGTGPQLVEVLVEGVSEYAPATPIAPGNYSSWEYVATVPRSGSYRIVPRATDLLGQKSWNSIYVTVSTASDAERTRPLETFDRFGIKKLFRSTSKAMEWYAAWDNDRQRSFPGKDSDPDDPWFDSNHGQGQYFIDGDGILVAQGDHVRMYVHDPNNHREWSENLEITTYVMRIAETQVLSYSGLQIFARTNHGTTGNERENMCDSRGYGAKIKIDGHWSFEKEVAHGKQNGYATTVERKPWDALPKDTWIGIKYVLRNIDSNRRVKLELYRDQTGGLDGGSWEKIHEFIDKGNNFGVGRDSCKQGVPPQMALIRSQTVVDSETEQPNLSVYLRHEHGTMRYSRFSIREIDPLP